MESNRIWICTDLSNDKIDLQIQQNLYFYEKNHIPDKTKIFIHGTMNYNKNSQ